MTYNNVIYTSLMCSQHNDHKDLQSTGVLFVKKQVFWRQLHRRERRMEAERKGAVCCDGSEEKLNILAIHGYRQSGETFRQKTGSFRKLAHKLARFTYITAPHRVRVVNSLEDVERRSDVEQEETKDESGI